MTSQLEIIIVRATDPGEMQNVVTLASFLASAGHRLTLLCYDSVSRRPECLNTAVELISLDRPSGSRSMALRLSAASRLKSLLRKRSFDVLYVVDSWTLPELWCATGGRFREEKAKLVYHTYDWLDPGHHSWFHRAMERAVCRKADLVVNTDRARARLQQSVYGLERTPLWVQNCLPKDTPAPKVDEDLRSHLLGGRKDGILVIYPTAVWNEESYQRQTYELIKAFEHLPESHVLITFYKPGVEYDRCQELLATAKLEKRVRLLPVMPFSEFMKHLACADVGAIFYDDSVSAGYFMANPDKLSLLAASGVPYVASECPNLEAITYKYGLGVCCKSGDPISIAEAIRELTDDRNKLSALKKHVRDVFEKELYFEKQGEKLLNALEEMFA